ncbi:HAD family hydrolase [Dactylosporangium sp. CA-233914]|uniref:HAD family hydrolase n=1 Tax=Dactylosporangium sp. CA-233914 TaxID=3239934 RepID=UPI003D923FA9
MALAIFDLDNTLIDREAAFRRWAETFVSAHNLPGEALPWLVEADGDGYTPRAQFLAAVAARYGVDKPAGDFRAELVDAIDLDPRVPALLDALRRSGWKVAIATNGTTAQQHAKLRRTGLIDHVDAVAVSEEVGAPKPDARMYEAAANRCSMTLTESAWMIGDCPARDMSGARSAGLRTIWLHRGRTWDRRSPSPDAEIAHITEAFAILSAAEPGPAPR